MATNKPKSKTARHTSKKSRPGGSGAKKRATTESKPKPASTTRKQTSAKSPSALSKQETVLGMLRQPKGTTIAAIMKATDWQQHSWYAALLRRRGDSKKAQIELVSDKVGDERVYRIAKPGAAS